MLCKKGLDINIMKDMRKCDGSCEHEATNLYGCCGAECQSCGGTIIETKSGRLVCDVCGGDGNEYNEVEEVI